MAYPVINEEIVKLAKFDDDFHSTFARADNLVRESIDEINRIKLLLVEIKKRYSSLLVEHDILVEKIKKMREIARQNSTPAHSCNENDDGEFGGYDSDGQFDYGTPPSVKAMVKLGHINGDIKSVSDKITRLYSQIDTIKRRIMEHTTPYTTVLQFAQTITDEMSDATKQIADEVFCWSKIRCGICTYHQRNKCIYGSNCTKAHVPVMAGYPYIRHHVYTNMALHM